MEENFNTNEEKSAYLEAITEAAFEKAELMEEIKCLLDEYFMGEFKNYDNKIFCNFLNGQSYTLILK